MSQPRASSTSQQATSISRPASSTGLSPSSTQPRSDRRPSSTPVIAGSLVGFIVLVVVLVLLFINKRRQLHAERVLPQLHHSDQTSLPQDGHRGKRGTLGVFNVPPIPQSQDSPSSLVAPSGVLPIPKPTHDHQHVHYHQPNNHHSLSHSYPSYFHHHPQLQPYQLQSHRGGGQSSTSSSSPAQSHTPLLSQQQTQNLNTHLIPGIGVPHGHFDAAVNAVADNNNNVNPNPAIIFGSASHVDAGADARNVTGEGGCGSNAGVPAIVVTRDGEDVGGESRGGGIRDGRGSAELSLVAGSGNWVDRAGGRDGLLRRVDERRFGSELGGEMGSLDGDRRSGRWRRISRSRFSASRLDYSDPASGSGNLEGIGGRMGDIGRVGLSPASGYSGRPRTASGSTSGSSLPSTLVASSTPSGTVIPPSPTKSAASSTGNLVSQNVQGQNVDVVFDNALLSLSVPPLMRQGQNQAYIGNTSILAAPPVVEEEAPPAYESVWAAGRQEEARLRLESGGEQERMQR